MFVCQASTILPLGTTRGAAGDDAAGPAARAARTPMPRSSRGMPRAPSRNVRRFIDPPPLDVQDPAIGSRAGLAWLSVPGAVPPTLTLALQLELLPRIGIHRLDGGKDLLPPLSHHSG